MTKYTGIKRHLTDEEDDVLQQPSRKKKAMIRLCYDMMSRKMAYMSRYNEEDMMGNEQDDEMIELDIVDDFSIFDMESDVFEKEFEDVTNTLLSGAQIERLLLQYLKDKKL